ncbi:hypothetical protein [Hymenobacter rigui]|uniref:hypothetical protein n=1 Tax=Hymenobacter rigui TaxID=334424 RepID=UPI0011CEFB8D|nr:hypothetical protein [Hymenobacter rigui]
MVTLPTRVEAHTQAAAVHQPCMDVPLELATPVLQAIEAGRMFVVLENARHFNVRFEACFKARGYDTEWVADGLKVSWT